MPTGPLPVLGALEADCHAPSAPHWYQSASELDWTQVRVGTDFPSVAELQ